MLRVLRICTVALAAAAALVGCSRQEPAGTASSGATAPAAGAQAPAGAERAPDFTLKDLSGHDVALGSLRGKTVLVDFWATWCPPCEFQIPVLNEVYAAHRAQGVEILGVSVDTEGPEVVSSYAQKHGVVYPVLLGSEALARDFGALGFPALVVVAPDGTIHSRHVGLVERDELEQVLAPLLSSPAT